ncbi:hypothetical protein [Salipiger sp.]|uniref:hypothetical protein n=1 Tax=Salipiger sp. TaxID=2078585 RepID=UPI003A96C572
MGNRADLGFGDELDGFDPAEWTPKPKPRPKAAPEERAASRELAEATGFRSREPAPRSRTGEGNPKTTAQPARQQRRRRTGRNAQFNIKARPETIEAFCAVADAKGWGLGETLEHAVALLQAHHGKGKSGG